MLHTVSASALVEAGADRVYSILADYRQGHPRVLPPQFKGLTVERGGVGDGTVIRYQMRLMGKTQQYRAAVSEPEPGRVLRETDLDAHGAVTTFTVDPVPGAASSRVSIATQIETRDGILGSIERLITTWALRPIFEQELKILAAVTAQP